MLGSGGASTPADSVPSVRCSRSGTTSTGAWGRQHHRPCCTAEQPLRKLRPLVQPERDQRRVDLVSDGENDVCRRSVVRDLAQSYARRSRSDGQPPRRGRLIGRGGDAVSRRAHHR